MLSGLTVYLIFIVNWDAHICGKLTPAVRSCSAESDFNNCAEVFVSESDRLHTSVNALELPAGFWRATLTKGHTLAWVMEILNLIKWP